MCFDFCEFLFLCACGYCNKHAPSERSIHYILDNYISMNYTIDFHNLHKLNDDLLDNRDLYNRTGKKSLRLNLKHLSIS